MTDCTNEVALRENEISEATTAENEATASMNRCQDADSQAAELETLL